MATGPEHYAMAERLLAHVEGDDTGVVYDEASSGTVATIAAAQVHATLALAAAQANAAARAGASLYGYGTGTVEPKVTR